MGGGSASRDDGADSTRREGWAALARNETIAGAPGRDSVGPGRGGAVGRWWCRDSVESLSRKPLSPQRGRYNIAWGVSPRMANPPSNPRVFQLGRRPNVGARARHWGTLREVHDLFGDRCRGERRRHPAGAGQPRDSTSSCAPCNEPSRPQRQEATSRGPGHGPIRDPAGSTAPDRLRREGRARSPANP